MTVRSCAVLLLALAAPAAQAQDPQATAAEVRRLGEEMSRLASRNAWVGVESAWDKLVEMGAEPTAEQALLAAQAARSVGDTAATLERLRLADELGADVDDQLAEITSAYGPVRLYARQGTATLAPSEVPFQPDRKASQDFAAKRLLEDGTFEGWVPAGVYDVAGTRLVVVAGDVAPATVDLRPSAKEDPCPARTTGELVALLEDAQQALAAGDLTTFRGVTDRVRLAVPCLEEEVPRHEAARIHRFQGLRSAADGDAERAAQAFAAARSIEPKYVFPASLLPPDSPLLAQYEATNPNRGDVELVPPPLEGRIQMDGRMSLERPTEWPTVLQLFDAEGAVDATSYLHPGEPMPVYEPLPEDRWDEVGYPTAGGNARLRTGAIAGAAVSGIATGLLLGLAGSSRTAWSEAGTLAEANAAQKRTNTFSTASAVTGALTVGFGVGIIVF